MGPNEIHPTVLKEVADVIAGPLSFTIQLPWESRKVPIYFKWQILSQFSRKVRRKVGNYSPDAVPGKIMDKIIQELLKNNGETMQSMVPTSRGSRGESAP